ncbi:hypothetical protein OHA44_37675 [Streptomyces sp. NBC_00144]|uniref:hypothetical protein n=1 Tax=Streptomyces sp. NBC_00144 TaxID=2975665 RepID=UPI003249F152
MTERPPRPHQEKLSDHADRHSPYCRRAPVLRPRTGTGLPAWATRLPYERARKFSVALLNDRTFENPAKRDGVLLAYLPRRPDADSGTLLRFDGAVTPDLRTCTHEVDLDLADLRSVGHTLRAHMPDKLEPLPVDPDERTGRPRLD